MVSPVARALRRASNARSSAGIASTASTWEGSAVRPALCNVATLCVVDPEAVTLSESDENPLEFVALDMTATSARWVPAAILPVLESGPLLCRYVTGPPTDAGTGPGVELTGGTTEGVAVCAPPPPQPANGISTNEKRAACNHLLTRLTF